MRSEFMFQIGNTLLHLLLRRATEIGTVIGVDMRTASIEEESTRDGIRSERFAWEKERRMSSEE